MNDQNMNNQNMNQNIQQDNWDIQQDNWDKNSIQNDETELPNKKSTQNDKTELDKQTIYINLENAYEESDQILLKQILSCTQQTIVIRSIRDFIIDHYGPS